MALRRVLLAAAGVMALGTAAIAADPAPEPFPQWVFPGAYNKSVAGSKLAWSDVQMYDRTIAVEWFPDGHPPMPAAVKGRMPLYACGYCHLPEGLGRPESAALAGMPYEYLRQQVLDMRSGARLTPSPTFGAAVNMMLTINHPQLTLKEADEAVKYFSQLKFTKHTRVIETTEIPAVRANGFVYEFLPEGPREPLGQRIVEGPDEFVRFEMRDPNTTFTAYVPVGSIARGAALAKGNGAERLPCESCHGVDLKGGTLGPPLAGRSATSSFRQMFAFKNGTRKGPTAVLMQQVVASLAQKDMIDVAAYVASLEP